MKLFGNKTTKINILLLTAVILLSFSIQANSQTIHEMNQFIGSDSHSSSANQAEAQEVKSLFYDLQPTYYFNGNYQQSGEAAPILGIINLTETEQLYAGNELHRNIKMLVIDYNNNTKHAPLDISKLKNFDKLSYIVIRCSEAYSMAEINHAVSNYTGSPVTLIYIIDIAE